MSDRITLIHSQRDSTPTELTLCLCLRIRDVHSLQRSSDLPLFRLAVRLHDRQTERRGPHDGCHLLLPESFAEESYLLRPGVWDARLGNGLGDETRTEVEP